MLYPLKFKPIYKQVIWGGKNISALPNRKSVPAQCGESWEISGLEKSESVVANGFLKGNSLSEIIEIYMGDIVGEQNFLDFGTYFPLLIKIIDTEDVLSVQVHPDDETAFEKHNSAGKTEMWYIIKADSQSDIINGFNKVTNNEEVREKIQQGTLTEILHHVPAVAGDTFFIPSGRVHAIGKGIMLAEIQQASDITYRLFDWNRKDAEGKGRELHIEDALEVLDYSDRADHYKRNPLPDMSYPLVNCDYFTVNKMELKVEVQKDYNTIDSFIVLLCTQGECVIKTPENEDAPLTFGETILIPACLELVSIEPKDGSCQLLEIYLVPPAHDH
ncbi:MAG: mannose-6-phosphate isomerase [Bacteroidetes bacterium HGW-Bacteroidetes-21]|jgi:mannose-6-phosphate isomerase|nr:MAG: mannose-6-phosphate isomerase [Bacteroidetes bacterium HGW-Bacteroidetes-21]